MTDFTENQEQLVKRSWEVLRQNIPKHSLRFFTLVVEIAPPVRNMFSFLRNIDGIPHNDPDLRTHAVKVFKMTCESAIQLRERGQVVVADGKLKYMCTVHRRRGVRGPHFEVVKEALLRTVKEAMGVKWSEEMMSAWAIAYDHLAAEILKGMQVEED